MKILEYHSEGFDQPRTVCMQRAKYAQIVGVDCMEHAVACHEGRYLDNAVPMALGDPNLTSCSSMSGGTCTPATRRAQRACHRRSWAAQRLRGTRDRRGAVEQAVRQSTEMGEQYGAEQRRTIEISPRFALFVEKNAILGFSASLGAS